MYNFRFWDKKHKKMLIVLSIDFDYGWVTTKRAEEKVDEILESGGHHCWSCDPEQDDSYETYTGILMLSTGLKDIHENYIYEGDILKCPFSPRNGIVYWDQGICSFNILLEDGSTHLFDTTGNYDYGRNIWDILGNVYENENMVSQKLLDKYMKGDFE